MEIEISSTLSTKPHLHGVYPFVKAAQALFFLNAAIWFMFGASSLVRMAKGNPDQRVAAGIIAMLMLLLTVTDEFGLFDFITLILDGILLGLLILIRPRR